MSKLNPKKAMAAILPLPLSCGSDDIVVKPMTLGMWAALERINSPLITGKPPKDALELIPSLYLLTHDPREVLAGDVLAKAFAWADTVPVSAMDAIRRACDRQMSAAYAVIPEDDEKKAKSAATTASLPRSRTGRPKPTTGASKTSSGTSRSRRSACSGGSNSSNPTAR